MRKARLTLLLAAGILSVSAVAQQPPVIDRELFFGDPEISAGQISPDGKYISFLKPLNKTRFVERFVGTLDPDVARPVTADTKRPIPGDRKSVV